MVIADLFQLNKDYSQITYITGQKGGGRKILDIDILELPDGMYWVKEGDFIITMGYFLKASDVKFENFVRMLIRNKASGLGVKLGRFFDEIPENALKLAEKNGFPIINYPLHMSYKSMTRPVLNYLLGEENYASFTLKEYKKELNGLVKEKYEISAIMSHLKRYINHDIFLVWENISGFIYKTSESGGYQVKKLLEENRFNLAYANDGRELSYEQLQYYIYRIGDKEQVLAFLCLMKDEDRRLTDTDIEIIYETMPYITIYLYSETRLGQYAARSKENFFMDILDGNYENREKDLLEDARNLGIVPDRPRCFVGVPVSGMATAATDRMYRRIGFYLDAFKLPYTLYTGAGCIYLILAPGKGGSARELERYLTDLAGDLREAFRRDSMYLCVSRMCYHLQDIPSAYEEFRYLAGKQFQDRRLVYFYEDFMMDHLLSDIQRQGAVSRVYENVMQKIENYDRSSKSDMKSTLSALAANDFNLTQTAEKLFVHRNTLYKRLAKIEKLLGFDLNNSETKLMLRLVMKLDEMKKP